MKRWGKSPPLQAQARRHGKPHRVQGQIGDLEAARFNPAFGRVGSGYWLPRQMILSARKSEDKIRLTALPKSFYFGPTSLCKTAGGLITPQRSTAAMATTSGGPSNA